MSMSGRRRLELERARQEALRLEQVHGECDALARVCEELLASVQDVAVQQLAADELRPCVQRLAQARQHSREQPDATRAELRAVAAGIQAAIVRGESKARAWTTAQTEAVAAARTAQAVASTSAATDAARLAREAEAAAIAGDLESSETLAEASGTAVEAATEVNLNEKIRREVVKGLMGTLRSMGFVLVGPRLHDGMVTMEGRLASGRRARFDVSLDGELSFDLDGYEGRACAKDMEKVETSLRDQFGVRLGPPQVVWKNPDRISRGAKPVPTDRRKKR